MSAEGASRGALLLRLRPDMNGVHSPERSVTALSSEAWLSAWYREQLPP